MSASGRTTDPVSRPSSTASSASSRCRARIRARTCGWLDTALTFCETTSARRSAPPGAGSPTKAASASPSFRFVPRSSATAVSSRYIAPVST